MRRVPCLLANIFPVFMPALSPSMETGTIVSWRKKIGDIVNENDVFCTVQTDKAVVEYTNTFENGYLAKILRGEGETVAVAETIALLVDSADDVGKVDDSSFQRNNTIRSAESTPATAVPIASPSSSLVAPSSSSSPLSLAATALSLCGGSLDSALAASGPAVLRITARLHRGALSSIRPTGKNGRFLKADFIGLPGFNYEENISAESPPSSSSSFYSGPTYAGTSAASPDVAVRTFAVHNFAVSDSALLQQLIRTMPVPKK